MRIDLRRQMANSPCKHPRYYHYEYVSDGTTQSSYTTELTSPGHQPPIFAGDGSYLRKVYSSTDGENWVLVYQR